MRQFGVLIDQVHSHCAKHVMILTILQSYPDTLGTPGTGCIISVSFYNCLFKYIFTDHFMQQDVNFVGSKTSLTVNSGAERVAVNCGKGSCTGKLIYIIFPASD